MAKRKPKDKHQENVSEAQPERELSKDSVPKKQSDAKQKVKKQTHAKKAGKKRTNDKQNLPAAESKKEISENEVFTGDKDFYKLLSESQQTDAKQQAGEQQG